MTLTRTLKHSKATLAFAAAGTLLAAAQASAGVTYLSQSRTVSASFAQTTFTPFLEVRSASDSAPNFAPYNGLARTFAVFGEPGPVIEFSNASQNSTLGVSAITASMVANYRDPQNSSRDNASAASSLATRFTLAQATDFAFTATWTTGRTGFTPLQAINAGLTFLAVPDWAQSAWSLSRVGGSTIFSQAIDWRSDVLWQTGPGGSRTYSFAGTLAPGTYDFNLSISGFFTDGANVPLSSNSLEATLQIPSAGITSLLGAAGLMALRRRR
jgi:hypothetical protein